MTALSHSATFSQKTTLVGAIAGAMEEAFDQRQTGCPSASDNPHADSTGSRCAGASSNLARPLFRAAHG